MLTKHRDSGHIDRDLDSITSEFHGITHSYFMTNMPWTPGNAQNSLGISRSPAFSLSVICLISGPHEENPIARNTLKAGLRPG